jgi:DNA invertase Pin-like site-specific DNA recombinase
MVTKLEWLARSLHQLVAIDRELEALGADLVVVDQTIDTTTRPEAPRTRLRTGLTAV